MANSVANFIPEKWSLKLQTIFDAKTVFAGLVNRDYEGEIKNSGDVVHIRTFGDVTINTYTRDMTPLVEQDVTDTMTDLTINVQKYFRFGVDDLDQAQADVNIMEGYAGRAAVAIRNVTDQHLHTVGYTNVQAANILGSSSSPLVLTKNNIYEYCTELGKVMSDSNADLEDRNLVVSPKYYQMMQNAPEFTRATGLGDSVVQNGKVGTIAGFTVHVSTNLVTVSGNTPILALNKYLISYASQVAKIEKFRPENQFRDSIKGLYLYGSVVPIKHAGQGAVLWAA